MLGALALNFLGLRQKDIRRSSMGEIMVRHSGTALFLRDPGKAHFTLLETLDNFFKVNLGNTCKLRKIFYNYLSPVSHHYFSSISVCVVHIRGSALSGVPLPS